MKNRSLFFVLGIFLLIPSTKIFPQFLGNQAFSVVELPHSVRNMGLGMNGVVSSSEIDALTYNPANLLFTKNPEFSFYHQGLQLIFGGMPINDYSIYLGAGKTGSFGIEYNDWTSTFSATTIEDPNVYETVKTYERNISFGYAKYINDNVGIGFSFRYGFASSIAIKYKTYLVSIGAFDKFSYLNKNWHAGISLMNLGPAVKYTIPNQPSIYDAPPTFLSLGLSVNILETRSFTLPISLSMTKPFDKYDDNGNGQSSFKTLFTDWKDFPNDASVSPGIAFDWNMLNLGDDFYLSQNFYIGNYSNGIKSGLTNFYTHGVEMSLSFKGVKLTGGYSGVWHNQRANSYLKWEFPYETLQFSLSVNPSIFSNSTNWVSRFDLSKNSIEPKNIIISSGAGQLFRVGNAKSISIQGVDIEQRNNVCYSIEAAFYLNKKSALVMSFSYNSLPYDAYYLQYHLVSMKIETLTLSSAFRYHPLENIKNFFIQGGLGIARLNPVPPTTPRYYYTTELDASIGYNFECLENIVLSPIAGYNLLLLDAWENRARISGNNQFNLGIRLGYKF